MKYNENNQPIQCMMTNSTCYKGTTSGVPVGVLWHSTGANNPNIKRYVQPSKNDSNYNNLINLIGKNTNGNSWNEISVQAGLNAWIGKLANGEIASVETLPQNYRAWGCGSGRNGSCNGSSSVKNSPYWYQFEICEASLSDRSYFEKVYKEACELTAYICKKYNINPKGTVQYNGVTVPAILCHADSYKLGLGSNHGDIYHWFDRYNKTMDDIRNDVYDLMYPKVEEEEDEDMTQEKFNEMMNVWLADQAVKEPAAWSKADRQWAESNGIIRGDDQGRKMYKKFVTREEMTAMLHRAHEL